VTIDIDKDTMLLSLYENENYGYSDILYAGVDNDGNLEASLIGISINSLPSASETTLTSATLSINIYASNGNQSFALGRITENWSETSVTFWTRPTISSFDSINLGCYPWCSVDITTYIDNVWQQENWSNYGVAIYEENLDPGNWVYMYSSDIPFYSNRPYVEVSFTCP